MTPIDAWASGDAYEPFIGRWSRLVAREFVGWLALPPGRTWLEIGCGTGALTDAVLALGAPGMVITTDRSEPYLRHARARLGTDLRLAGGFVSDAMHPPVRPGGMDAVVSGLVLNFLPAPDSAVSQLAGSLRPGGTIAAYVWDYAAGMELLRIFWDAAVELDPSAGELDEGRRFPVCHPDALIRLWRAAGLSNVECVGLDVPTALAGFDDYWSPFLGGQGPAPAYVASLGTDAREALRRRLLSRLGDSGPITLRARAWAVRGERGGDSSAAREV